MSRAEALARAQSLREALLDHGVRAVSIELQQGRPGTPNDQWWDQRFLVPTSHHIVSRRSQGLTPGLALVKRGRSDVPGPLANLYGGFDRISRIICMGWANHPGAGGPLVVRGFRIPKDTGRPYLMGTEFEGGIDADDWTDEFREFMGRHNAGVTDYLGASPSDHIEHKTWAPDRKIDRLGYTTASGRAEVAHWYAATNTEPEDDMPYTKEQLEQFAANGDVRAIRDSEMYREAFKQLFTEAFYETVHGNDPTRRELQVLPWLQQYGRSGMSMHNAIGGLIATVGALQAAVQQLAVGQGLDPTALQIAIESGAEAAVRNVLGGLDEADPPAAPVVEN